MESVHITETCCFISAIFKGLICVPLILRMMETALSTASRILKACLCRLCQLLTVSRRVSLISLLQTGERRNRKGEYAK